MEKTNLQFFYQLGFKLHALTDMSVNAENRTNIFFQAWAVGSEVEALLKSISSLHVCRKVGRDLLTAIKSLTKWFSETKAEERHKTAPEIDWQFQSVINKAREFETVLTNELQILATYHVTQKGIYSTSDLIEKAEHIFPESIRQKTGPELVEEIRQSGRCLAFDVPTASGFHILRATEVVMHEYYLAVCKPKSKPTDKLENWGAYLAELRKCNDPDVGKVVAILQLIKDQDRNLIMHPEISLSLDEAFNLFEIAKGAIIAMSTRLPPKTGIAISSA